VAIVTSEPTSTSWSMDHCSFSTAVTVYTMASGAKVGAYLLDDVRDEFPNARITSSHTPAVGAIQGYFNGLFDCYTDGGETRFALVLYARKVQRPDWDGSTNDTDHFVVLDIATDNAEFRDLLEAQTGFAADDVIDAARQVVTADTHRIFYDVTGRRDVDAVVSDGFTTDAFPGPLRFWFDARIEDPTTNARSYHPTPFTISSPATAASRRYDQGTITVRDSIDNTAAFLPNGAAAQGLFVDLDDATLTLGQPSDLALNRTYYE
jgi:hypothetical protein